MRDLQERQDSGAAPAMVRVWDPFVRVFHWTLAAAYFVAFLSGNEIRVIHVWAGYLIATLLALRVVWGVVGPRRARFADFIYAPAKVWRYLLDLLRFRSRRYLGHSPAGGAMVMAILIVFAATAWTGMETYAVKAGAGPLATPELTAAAEAAAAAGERRRGGLWQEVHETLGNLTMALVVFHLGGVLLASIAHRENLPRSMITGLKRPE